MSDFYVQSHNDCTEDFKILFKSKLDSTHFFFTVYICQRKGGCILFGAVYEPIYERANMLSFVANAARLDRYVITIKTKNNLQSVCH